MNELLLAAILGLLLLQWLNISPGSVGDYAGWRWRELRRWFGNYRARRRKRKLGG